MSKPWRPSRKLLEELDQVIKEIEQKMEKERRQYVERAS